MNCAQCKREFASGEKARASISIFVMGDEYTYSYWSCPECGYYTVDWYHDRFLGEDDSGQLAGAYPKEVGDRCVELVRACERPWDKNCGCDSHQKLYYGLPRD